MPEIFTRGFPWECYYGCSARSSNIEFGHLFHIMWFNLGKPTHNPQERKNTTWIGLTTAHSWETLVIFGVNFKELNVHMNMGNVMGNVDWISKNFKSEGNKMFSKCFYLATLWMLSAFETSKCWLWWICCIWNKTKWIWIYDREKRRYRATILQTLKPYKATRHHSRLINIIHVHTRP